MFADVVMTYASRLFLFRCERAAEFVGQRAERAALGILPLGVRANVLGGLGGTAVPDRRDGNPPAGAVDSQDLDLQRRPRFDTARPSILCAGWREARRVRQRFDAWLERDERAERRDPRHAAGVDRADFVNLGHTQ